MADMRMHMRGFYGLRLVAGPNWLSRLGRFTGECSERSGFSRECGQVLVLGGGDPLTVNRSNLHTVRKTIIMSP